MRVVLAEKPSVARELAAFLGATGRHEGYLEGQGHQVTWAFGHLVTLKEPDDYDPALKRWSLATLPFVPDRFGLKLIDEKGAAKQFAVIKRLLRAADGRLVDNEARKEALKEKGLGTPATRAATIETLLTRGYIVREGKAVVSTDAGRYLIALIRDRGLKSAELTGEWEARLREIEHGRLDPDRFMADIAGYTAGIVGGADGDAIDETRLGDCPRCGRAVIEGKRGYGCSGWKEGCPFVLWKEYKGGQLDAGHARELLQRRVLFTPPAFEGSGGVILTLSDAGAVLEVRTPQAPPPLNAAPAKASKSSRRKNVTTPLRTPPSREKPPRKPKSDAGEATTSEGIGPCPLCGAAVVEQERAYGCSGWRGGCKFAVWKMIAGKKISATMAQALVRKGRTALLKGFKSKAGKPFDARLKVENGAVRFEFEG